MIKQEKALRIQRRCSRSMKSMKFLQSLNFLIHNFLLNVLRVRPKLSCLREAAPLLDLDRDERKLDAFLQLHKTDLQVSDLRIFLPFTVLIETKFHFMHDFNFFSITPDQS